MRTATRRNPPDPAPTPTPHTGPFVMSVEFPTPQADEPTRRIPYEEVATIEEAVAWIRHPPFPPEILKKLKKGVLLTARMQAEWVQENGQRGEEIAAMGLVLHVGTKNSPTKIAVVTRDGISIDGKRADADALGLTKASARDITAWLDSESTSARLLDAGMRVPMQLRTLTACAVARSVLHLTPDGGARPRVALETAEAWAYGRATLTQVGTAEVDARSPLASGPAAWALSAALRAVRSAVLTEAASSAARAALSATSDLLQHARIVRAWIGLPEVAFAIITRKK